MKLPPEDDLSPGRDALVLAMAGNPSFVAMSRHSVGLMPVQWQAHFSNLITSYKEFYVMATAPVTHLEKDKMLAMNDEWQAQMAKLISDYSLAHPSHA